MLFAAIRLALSCSEARVPSSPIRQRYKARASWEGSIQSLPAFPDSFVQCHNKNLFELCTGWIRTTKELFNPCRAPEGGICGGFSSRRRFYVWRKGTQGISANTSNECFLHPPYFVHLSNRIVVTTGPLFLEFFFFNGKIHVLREMYDEKTVWEHSSVMKQAKQHNSPVLLTRLSLCFSFVLQLCQIISERLY